jgi:hypothetical protein
MSDMKKLYSQLSNHIDKLEQRQRKLTGKLFKPEDLIVRPRLYLRGQFLEYDIATHNLQIKINGHSHYYPLHLYDSAWLAFPGHQVLVFNTEHGVRVSGFGANGVQIPSARREEMTLLKVFSAQRQWVFGHLSGTRIQLPIPELLPEDTELKIGSRYRFKVIESLPDRFYILDKQLVDINTRENLVETIMHSAFTHK